MQHNKLQAWLKTFLVGSLVASLPLTAIADEAAQKGYAIAKERKVRDTGWISSEQSMQMILRNAQGDESVREMRSKNLEVTGDGDKGLTVFDKPRDVKGTAFLSFSHINEADDQWLYLPALKRVKRISSRNKSGPFMGSEFAYEDLSSFELEKYKFTYLRDEACPTDTSVNCFVIESIPTDKFSGYSKTHVWIDTAEYRMHKVDYYDRKKSLLKTLTAEDFKQYQNKFWRAHTMTVVNHQTGKSTVLKTSDIKFNVGLTDSDFNKNSLKRIR
ncbi:outer membrane lipoprotein-sorting protein [Saccharobesus litoralis]|uniref:Outer membrane lipoprotein-sorting protein n=1 Tax=Saccharobesus litoralis TaxID=2172099 RepID=A0A2S0VQR8_9ALTE|nr:outer membrane lipoprotein-sorting protein [Saccharobesus litoralis]AWB66539.1 outer membrane lipoprotein-sorting protein [Saccharobesus litoralis]